jgi:hypothetical protein
MRVRIRKHATEQKWHIETKKWYQLSWEYVDCVTDLVCVADRKNKDIPETLTDKELEAKAIKVAKTHKYPRIIELTDYISY